MKEQDIINYYFENAKSDIFGIDLEEVLSESDFIEALQVLASLTEEQINEAAESIGRDYENYIYSESSKHFEHPFSFIFEAEAAMAGPMAGEKGSLGKAPGTSIAKKAGYATGKAVEKAKGFFGKLKEKAGELLKSMGNAISNSWQKIKSLPENIVKASSTAKKDFMIGLEKGLKAGKAPAAAAKEAAAAVGVQIDEKQAASIANSIIREVSAQQETAPAETDAAEDGKEGTKALSVQKKMNPGMFGKILQNIKANYKDIANASNMGNAKVKLNTLLKDFGVTGNSANRLRPVIYGFISNFIK